MEENAANEDEEQASKTSRGESSALHAADDVPVVLPDATPAKRLYDLEYSELDPESDEDAGDFQIASSARPPSHVLPSSPSPLTVTPQEHHASRGECFNCRGPKYFQERGGRRLRAFISCE